MTEVSSGFRRVMILLPTLNEEEGLQQTLDELPLEHIRQSGFEPTVVVLDAQSTDRTREVALRSGATVLVQEGRGKGRAMREGLAWAVANRMEYIAVLDADHTYPGTGVPPILALLDAGSDLVIGVRRPEVPASIDLRTVVHRLGNGLLNYLAAWLSRSPVLDVCSGLWGIRTASFADIDLTSDGFEIEAELFLKAFGRGLRVSQIPINYRERIGTAKLHAARDGARISLAILRFARSGRRDAPIGVERAAGPQTTLPDLQAIILATDARELVVYSADGRAAEAEALAQQLRAAQLGVRVEIRPYVQLVQERFGPHDDLMGIPSEATGRVPIVVTLPSAGPDSEALPVAVVGLPHTKRVLFVGESQGGTPSRAGESSNGFRLEKSVGRRLGSLTRLSTSLDASLRGQELALLAANGSPRGLQVYHWDLPSPPARSRSSPPIGQADGH